MPERLKHARLEVPEIISAEQRCFRALTFSALIRRTHLPWSTLIQSWSALIFSESALFRTKKKSGLIVLALKHWFSSVKKTLIYSKSVLIYTCRYKIINLSTVDIKLITKSDTWEKHIKWLLKLNSRYLKNVSFANFLQNDSKNSYISQNNLQISSH